MSICRALAETIPGWPATIRERTDYCIGVLRGEGIGPEVLDVALQVLEAACEDTPYRFDVRTGGAIGRVALRASGLCLTTEVVDFCEDVFQRGGAVLCGPAGGRFVYELRRRFDLFCKLVPLRPLIESPDFGVIRSEALRQVDILVVRENTGGVYLGDWRERTEGGRPIASHTFEYSSDQVERILRVAAGLAGSRRQRLTVAVKSEGIPTISRLWCRRLEELAQEWGVSCDVLQIDNLAYQLIQSARQFDVVVAPNMLGDILADVGALLLGSRGMSFSGNFGDERRAVYQTAHGAAYDLEGHDRANPVAQVLSVAMLVRMSFGLEQLAVRIEDAVARTLREGWRTPDVASPNSRVVGTRELGQQIVAAIRECKAEATA